MRLGNAWFCDGKGVVDDSSVCADLAPLRCYAFLPWSSDMSGTREMLGWIFMYVTVVTGHL